MGHRIRAKAKQSKPTRLRRQIAGLEALEARAMLAADFGVFTDASSIWIEANGSVQNAGAANEFQSDDVFTLRHISQNEVRITIDFQVDADESGAFGDGVGSPDFVDTIVESFDVDMLEFQAALAGKNFTGFRINGLGGDDVINARMLSNYDDNQFTFNGGAGDDEIRGGRRGDVINGGNGDDTILFADDRDTISGGAGFDAVVYGPNSLGAEADDLDDTVEAVTGTPLDDVIDLSGQTADVTIVGRGGDDILSGGSGNDTINGGGGDDTIDGNGGNDRLGKVPTGVPGDTALLVGLLPGTPVTLADAFDAEPGDDTIIGDGGNDRINGDGGRDNLTGNAGDDTLVGGAGRDDISGGDNNDLLWGGTDNDRLDGGANNDVLRGGDGDDWLVGGLGNDTLDGGDGDNPVGDGGDGPDGDTIDYSAAPSGVFVNLSDANGAGGGINGTATGGAGNDTIISVTGFPNDNSTIENVVGTSFDDTLLGDDVANLLEGESEDAELALADGNDTIFGRGGDDTMYGRLGDDIIGSGAAVPGGFDGAPAGEESVDVVGPPVLDEDGDDYVDGGAGNDVLRGGTGDDTILGGDDNDTIEGDGWYTTVLLDRLHLESGDDTIDAGDGNDTVYASDSEDPFDGDSPADNAVVGGVGDYVDGGDGSDTLYGAAGDDTLLGDDETAGDVGDDWLFGGRGVDMLIGGAGEDLLVGGRGVDTTLGGDGDDEIRLESNGAGTALVDFFIFGGTSPGETDTFVVKGATLAGQVAITNQLANDVGVMSDFDTAFDDLNFVTSFDDFEV